MARWSLRFVVAACVLFGMTSAASAQAWKISGDLIAADQLAQKIWASSATVPLSEALAGYPAAFCIEMGRLARLHHRRHQVKPFLMAVLERPLSNAEGAEAKYELAQVCEQMQEGPEVRRLYGEILRDCPDFDRGLPVCRRYGALHNYAIMRGTMPDWDKAIEILQWAVRRYPNCHGDTLACRVQLGNLLGSANRWREAQAQFLAIYDTPPESLRLPPEFQPNFFQTDQQQLHFVRRRWESYRPKLVQKIVNKCGIPEPTEGYAALTELIERYPGTDLEAAARDKINEIRQREIDELEKELE